MCVCIIINISLAYWLSHIWHYAGLVRMFIIFNGVYILQGILSQFQWIEQANFRFRGILISTMIRQGGFFLFVFTSYLFHFHVSLIDLIYMQAICIILAAYTEYFFIREHLVFTRKIALTLDREIIRLRKVCFWHLSHNSAFRVNQPNDAGNNDFSCSFRIL